jgi:hypothetical protein
MIELNPRFAHESRDYSISVEFYQEPRRTDDEFGLRRQTQCDTAFPSTY